MFPVEEPKRPAAHAFCVALEEPALHHEPALQAPVHVEAVLPAPLPNLPAAQSVQLAEQVEGPVLHGPVQY